MVGPETLSDAQVLGLTGAAEARSELVAPHGWRPAPLANMVAVMCTPLNRVQADPRRFGADVKAACLKPEQYSCWNVGSGSNHDWLMEQVAAIANGKYVAPIVLQCIAVAAQLLDGEITDTVHGATSYFSPVSMVPPGHIPSWAVGKTPAARIGDQFWFYV